MSNEQILIEYIKQQKHDALSAAWVIWALNYLNEARAKGLAINPDYLRAQYVQINDPEPEMLPCQPT